MMLGIAHYVSAAKANHFSLFERKVNKAVSG
jgi:hypothetical protein